MREMLRTTCLTLAIAAGWGAWSASGGQAPPAAGKAANPGTIQACSLTTKAEVEKITGQRVFGDPEPTALIGGSACMWGSTQVVLFSGDKSEERYDALLKNFGRHTEKRKPVAGVGDRAYLMLPKPRNEYEDAIAALVVTVGQHTVAVSVAAEEGQSAESVQPAVMALAKAVVAKLR